MLSDASYLYWLIVACEAAFWVVLVFGLAARYLLRRELLSRALLLSLPAIDLLLLAFTTVDLKSGTPATFAHGLATAYVGFTVAFGAVAVAWADQHFAHRFAAGPPPTAAPSRGWAAVRYDLELWLRCIVAWVITLVLLTGLIALVDDATITQPLEQWFRIAFGSTVLWFLFGPVWSLVFFRRAEAREMDIRRDDLTSPVVHALLAEHLRDMHAWSPACSVHALDLDGLKRPEVTFWSVWTGDELMGCGALKQISATHGEIKSMRTASAHRRMGVAQAMLAHLLSEAQRRGYTRLSLETGSQPHFEPARQLYARNGFSLCSPFEGYVPDPNSTFMTREL